jgi:hypothetical protein
MTKRLAWLSIERYIYRAMPAPYFPSWRCQLAALGRRTARTFRQTNLGPASGTFARSDPGLTAFP